MGEFDQGDGAVDGKIYGEVDGEVDGKIYGEVDGKVDGEVDGEVDGDGGPFVHGVDDMVDGMDGNTGQTDPPHASSEFDHSSLEFDNIKTDEYAVNRKPSTDYGNGYGQLSDNAVLYDREVDADQYGGQTFDQYEHDGQKWTDGFDDGIDDTFVSQVSDMHSACG
jgi:hypothetical protein